MKLQDIFENMLSGDHPEFTPMEVSAAGEWFRDGGTSVQLENHKFELIRKGNSFGLFRVRDGALLGWVLFDKSANKYGFACYPLVNIQILPDYRKSMAAWLLINGVRGALDLPVVVDNTVFTGGQQLLVAMAKRASMPKVSVLDKTTGDVKPFVDADIKINPNTAFVLESGHKFVVVECAYPGGAIHHPPDWLNGLTDDIE
jgi:hypothetical protein